MEHFWLVEKLEHEEDGRKYRAIDCNHRLSAFLKLGIEKATALIFENLSEDNYGMIAGIIIIYFFIFVGTANELHDAFCVQVTEWEKFNVLARYFSNEKYKLPNGFKHKDIVEHLVSYFLHLFFK